jgi:hypothetical protein
LATSITLGYASGLSLVPAFMAKLSGILGKNKLKAQVIWLALI